MKICKRKIVAIIMSAFLVFNSTSVFALTDAQKNDTEVSGQALTKIMRHLLDEYAGGKITEKQLYEGALRGMFESLDAYSRYFTDEEFKQFLDMINSKQYALGFNFQLNEKQELVVKKTIKGSSAEAAGLANGDILYAYNGVDLSGLDGKEINMLMNDKNVKKVELEVMRSGKILTFKLEKQELYIPTVGVGKLEELIEQAKNKDNSKIAYIAIHHIGTNTYGEFSAALEEFEKQGKTRLVLDLRGNPGGAMDVTNNILNLIVPKGVTYTVVDSHGKKEVFKSNLEKLPFEKMVVLTDHYTASAAEVITSALKDSNAATIVGQTTYGKGVVQSVYDIKEGGAVKFTIREYFSRNGTTINKIGIEPNVKVDLPEFLKDFIVKIDRKNSSKELPNIKKILRFLGYATGEIDTYYDEQTKESVKKFQADIGYTVDGKLSYETVVGLNLSLYNKIITVDPILVKGYEEINK